MNLSEFYIENRPKLIRYAYNFVRNWEEAKDIVHAVCYKCLKAKAENLSLAYFYIGIRNIVYDRLRYVATPDSMQIELEPIDPYQFSYEDQDIDMKLSIGEVINEQNPQVKEMMLMYMEGFTFTEISKKFKIPETTIVYQFKKLRKVYEKEDLA